MTHTVKDKAKLLSRVRRIQGQAAALERMLESEAGHAEFLQQLAALRGAVNGLMSAVIEGHLVEHLVEEHDYRRRQQDLDAVLQTLKSYLR
ncbi:MAG: metal/formaldehyde-sensitive transcriptional repressor [Nevskiaceae bacterium]|nr:MAG: metal/formaldehyde-sensitive transcriptional repressor [Nevskiaceae bacterium]